MSGRPNTLAEVAERRLSEFLDQFYPALASGGTQAMIAMEPATLADVREHDPMLTDLLPRGARDMSARDLATLEKWFGATGKFPAVKIETGELGL